MSPRSDDKTRMGHGEDDLHQGAARSDATGRPLVRSSVRPDRTIVGGLDEKTEPIRSWETGLILRTRNITDMCNLRLCQTYVRLLGRGNTVIRGALMQTT